MKKRILPFLLLAVLLTLCACGGEQTDGSLTAEQLDAVFSKTVHDFEGYRVDNLDADETTNFVVYQKGTVEITMTPEVNALAEADEDAMTYRFENADETLKALEKGDVFYGTGADGVSAIAVKVASIAVEGDSVQIQGAELTLGELYQYVDVDMELSPESVIVGNLYGDTQTQWGGTESTAAYTGMLPSQQLGDVYTHVPLALKFTLSLSGSIGDSSLGGEANVKGSITLSGRATYALNSLDVVFRFYDDKDAIFYSGVALNSDVDTSIKLTGQGTGSYTVPFADVKIPVPAFPLLTAEGTLNFYVSASGSITGGVEVTQTSCSGFEVGATASEGWFCNRISDVSDPAMKSVNIEDLAATVCIGATADLGLGTWGVAKIYGEAFAGVEFKGSYDPFEVDHTADEAIHDCDVCVDGSVDFLAKGAVGAKIGMKGLKQASASWTFAELRWDFKDFYISLGRQGINEPEFGWDKCPYKRFRTDITVLNEGEKVKNAKVKAESADGRTFETTSDENGCAELFLPVGDNVVTASSRGAKGTANVPIKDSPVSVTINLTDERQIFVVCSFNWLEWGDDYSSKAFGIEKWPFIIDAIRARYPDAVFVSATDWFSKVTGGGNYTLGGLVDAYGVSPGDVLVSISAYSATYFPWINGQHVECDTGYPDELSIGVNMVMQPSEVDVEAGVRQDEPYFISFGISWADIERVDPYVYGSETEGTFTTYTSGLKSKLETDCWLGMEFDEDFRIKGSENQGYWTGYIKKEIMLSGSTMTDYAFYTGMEAYSRMNLEYALDEIAPIVDALWNNEWDRDESGDIVIEEVLP